MKARAISWVLAASATAAMLAACGGSDDDEPPKVLGANLVVPASGTALSTITNVPITFAAGVPDLGTTASTTVTFTSNAATPAFSIASGGATATGTTTFGSCIFAVTNSTFAPTHPLAAGKTVRVQPCDLSFLTRGYPAGSVPSGLNALVQIGQSTSSTVQVIANNITILADGTVTLGGNVLGRVPVVDSTGGTGGGG